MMRQNLKKVEHIKQDESMKMFPYVLGTDWAAETYYGEPAKKLGLDYIGYKILPRESSLYEQYDKNDPILRDPRSITQKGWQFTKGIYLTNQQVRLDLRRFKKILSDTYAKSSR
ncbi:hypothetical protein F2Q69_00032055 [Brassica cretica]|uniref:Uncharacterized protein n=1 Tax=Brassica cretica TaxID=69181 RepID=A0A8S9S843_BRACR|nr:hypothetical protein F2Q69_00032055 [Brassica cretica]